MSTRAGGARRTRLGAVAALAALLALATGCAGMPASGPIVETDDSRGSSGTTGVFYDPLPPLPDASQSEIVKGFLDAMTAVPIQTTSAGQFLTQAARTSWRPERETITYGDRTPAMDSTNRVTVRLLDGANRFDATGAWRGPLVGDQLELAFGLALEQGEWRISQAPDALIVPESWFESRFRRLSLSFFDPSAQILVPEPVFVANDDALATRLVEGLLDGPGPELGSSSRSFFPVGTRSGLSVPVSPGGVADVTLSDVGQQTPEAQRLMVVQLAATLRQVVGITALRVTVDGELLQLDGSDDGRFPIDIGQEYDPAVPGASAIVFGLRDGLLAAGNPAALDPVTGAFGAGDLRLGSFAVSLDGGRAAGVTEDGSSVVLAPVNGDPSSVRGILDRGTDLLEPSWDFTDRLWLVDRRGGDARVRYFEDGRLRTLEVPGVTGGPVREFLVSRDGSRLVAVVTRGQQDVLVVSRILHGPQGKVQRATEAATILGEDGETETIKDIAWRSPTSVAALTRVTEDLWEVRSVPVDGAPTGLESIANLSGPVRALAGSPVADQGLLVLAPDEALDLSGPVARAVQFPEGERPDALDYVG